MSDEARLQKKGLALLSLTLVKVYQLKFFHSNCIWCRLNHSLNTLRLVNSEISCNFATILLFIIGRRFQHILFNPKPGNE